ncbi:MAG: hypothetical protein OEU32_12600 [Acidimicrobiia bacterium]|nr:hypothetical protein [Acidimicrobiia bacterium]
MTPHRDATEVDPDGHRVVFENEHVRILEVRGATGTELAQHSHPPRVVVAIGPYRVKSVDTDGVETIIDRRPGDAAWVEQEHHAAQVLVGPTHAIEVEVKSAAPDTTR